MTIHSGRSPATQSCPRPTELIGCLALGKDPRSAPIARRFVRIALVAGGYDAHSENLELIVSELVTNALVHARFSSATPIEVRVLATESTIRLEVHDADMRLPLARFLNTDDEFGRGLYIVQALTVNRGSYRNGTGKCVWCEVEIKSKQGW